MSSAENRAKAPVSESLSSPDPRSLAFTHTATSAAAVAPGRPGPAEPGTPAYSSASKPSRFSLPFSFPLLPPRTTAATTATTTTTAAAAAASPSLSASSTAQAKPISPLTRAGSVSVLRDLRSHLYRASSTSRPTQQRYTSSGAASQGTRLSQPITVRTYSPLPTSRPRSAAAGPALRPAIARTAFGPTAGKGLPSTGGPSSQDVHGRGAAIVRHVFPASGGPLQGILNMAARKNSRARGPAAAAADDNVPHLPPVEAFSFKSFMENIEAGTEGIQGNINADLDRIAEICARSKYSLSNQYEVHYAPHGSGAGFLSNPSHHTRHQQPNPQAPSDDEGHAKRRRRRNPGRRNRVVGTLETIVSSNRSSDEDRKDKKKSAADIAADVRDRATAALQEERPDAMAASGVSQPGGEATNQTKAANTSLASPEPAHSLAKKKSFTSALMDPSRVSSTSIDSNALLSEPSLPQTSTSQLQTRTAADDTIGEDEDEDEYGASDPSTAPPDVVPPTTTQALGHQQPSGYTQEGAAANLNRIVTRQERATRAAQNQGTAALLSGLSGWIPWRLSAGRETPASRACRSRSQAEGSLRDLLGGTERWMGNKGKGATERA